MSRKDHPKMFDDKNYFLKTLEKYEIDCSLFDIFKKFNVAIDYKQLCDAIVRAKSVSMKIIEPWQILALSDSKVLIEQFLSKNIMNDVTDTDGCNFLHFVSFHGNLEAVKYLLAYHKVLNVPDKFERNVLHFSAQGGNYELTLYLLNKYKKFNVSSCFGQNVLHYSAWGGNLKLVKYLLDKYPELLVVDKCNRNLLHFVAWGGNKKLMEWLLTEKIYSKLAYDFDKVGRNILYYAAQFGHFELVICLLEKYPSLAAKVDKDSRHLLHFVAWGGNEKLMKHLLTNEKYSKLTSLVYKTDKCGDNILNYATKHGHFELTKYLLDDYLKLIDSLPDDSNGPISQRSWVICDAARGGCFKLFRYLLISRFPELINTPKFIDEFHSMKKSLLHCAVESGNWRSLEFLLNTGKFQKNVVDQDGQNILHCAVFYGHLKLVKCLMKRYPELAVDYKNKNLLEMSIKSGNLSLVKYFLEEKLFKLTKTVDLQGNKVTQQIRLYLFRKTKEESQSDSESKRNFLYYSLQ